MKGFAQSRDSWSAARGGVVGVLGICIFGVAKMTPTAARAYRTHRSLRKARKTNRGGGGRRSRATAVVQCLDAERERTNLKNVPLEEPSFQESGSGHEKPLARSVLWVST
jgi:hypothetical protein